MNNTNLIHNLGEDKQKKESLPKKNGLLFFSSALIFGLISGFILFILFKPGGNKTISSFDTGGRQRVIKKQIGIKDKRTFKDKAEGVLREGGIDGEGNFHLERPGGESQNVYLTSTTVDLSKYIGKKIRVWGETFKAEKAGWLMDVGLVEIFK